MSVFFIAGVHGVGKSTTCANAAKAAGLDHYTASEIIRGAKESAISRDTKRVRDVIDNQRLLVDGVRRLVESGRRLILDGHCTLQTDHGIEPIPVSTFESLYIKILIVLTDAPRNIAMRAILRDGRGLSIKEVQRQQNAEMAHAKVVASALQVPLVALRAFDVAGLQGVVSRGT